MSYNVHNFYSGQVLTAQQLNEMDLQISANDSEKASLSGATFTGTVTIDASDANDSVIISPTYIGGNGCNIQAITVSVGNQISASQVLASSVQVGTYTKFLKRADIETPNHIDGVLSIGVKGSNYVQIDPTGVSSINFATTENGLKIYPYNSTTNAVVSINSTTAAFRFNSLVLTASNGNRYVLNVLDDGTPTTTRLD